MKALWHKESEVLMEQKGNSLLEERSGLRKALWYKLMHGPLYKRDPSPVVSRMRELVQHRAKVAKHDFLISYLQEV